ncbi:MAG TPA: TPM domain-containing protein [Opitutaceae bacterium]
MSLFGPQIDHDSIVEAIAKAEKATSGEIRVIVARHKAADPVASAQEYFNKMGMANSAHRNGVLVFVAPRSRNFAIIGDTAVHEKCGDAFWSSLATTMGHYFKEGRFTYGIVHGVERAGELLAKTFPRSGSDEKPRSPSATEVD